MVAIGNTFWRLDPDDSDDGADIIGTPELAVPGDTVERPRTGHGIVLASWDEDRLQGRVHALGVVSSVDKATGIAIVDWRRANFTVSPSGQGCSQWRKRRFFKFAAGPTEKYRLEDHFAVRFEEGAASDDYPDTTVVADLRGFASAPQTQRAHSPSAPTPRAVAPQCNRVSPNGDLIATTARGTLMGNRADRVRWLVCELHFERELKEERKYTKLFFLDEAVALSAGHRPCQTCRRDRYQQYLASVQFEHAVVGAPDLDQLLSAARQAPRPRAAVASLPDGAFVELGDDDYRIVWSGALHRWSPAGYGEPATFEDLGAEDVTVLTPHPSLAALRRGYPVVVHPSIVREPA
jgi:hypothetical protein